MENFTNVCPVRNYFGKGIMEEALTSELKDIGKNVLLAYGGGSVKRNGIYEKIRSLLENADKKVMELPGITADPSYEKVFEGAAICRQYRIDFILAVGGGSVSDCCKVIAAQAKLDEDLWEYECVKRLIPSEYIPMGTVLTAFGTGSEQNNSGVVTNSQMGEKRSLKGAYPSFAILDVNCSRSLPKDLLLAGAFDTLSHCMEIYFSLPEGMIASDELNEAVMRNIIRNMWKLKDNPESDDARLELAWDSTLPMNGTLKAGKRAAFQVHQIAHQLGAYTEYTHGKLLAVIQPTYYKHVYERAIEKFARFAREVWGVGDKTLSDDQTAVKGIEELNNFVREIDLPTTFEELGGISQSILNKVAETTFIMDTSCIRLTKEIIRDILEDCL